jgi:hypothetical protein
MYIRIYRVSQVFPGILESLTTGLPDIPGSRVYPASSPQVVGRLGDINLPLKQRSIGTKSGVWGHKLHPPRADKETSISFRDLASPSLMYCKLGWSPRVPPQPSSRFSRPLPLLKAEVLETSDPAIPATHVHPGPRYTRVPGIHVTHDAGSHGTLARLRPGYTRTLLPRAYLSSTRPGPGYCENPGSVSRDLIVLIDPHSGRFLETPTVALDCAGRT